MPRARISIMKESRQCTPCVSNKKICSNCSRIFGQAQNSKRLKQEISIFKENRQCEPCVPNKTICNPIVQEYMDKLKIPNTSSKNFPARNKTDRANHACLTIQSNSNWSRIFGQAQNSKCLKQEISIFDKTGSFPTFYICWLEIWLYARKANIPGTPPPF